MNEDPRVARLMRRLEGPLDRASTRDAEERVWRRVREHHPLRSRLPVWQLAAAALALVLVVVWGVGYAGTYRFEVASGGRLVLYQEHVAETDLSVATPSGKLLDATLEIRQGHYSATRPDLLRVVAIDDVRLTEAALPATVEIRFREQGSVVSGVLARTADITETRRGTGEARHNVVAPLPPVARGEVRVFEVWIHVDTANGPIGSPMLIVEVRGAPEGERARSLP